MNPAILHTEVQQFINKNLNANIAKILFKGSPFKDVSAKELVTQIISKKKCQKKLPTWFSTEISDYPEKLNIEQTSSELTANYKSSLISGNSIIDVTGGYGVDCLYFSKKIKHVTHCELNTYLSTIVQNNYQQFKNEGVEFISGDGIEQ